jgi:ribosomal protein L37E
MGCRHCGRQRVNRPRGLCWTCYYTPSIRARYASTSKFARRGIADIANGAAKPSEATGALPGTDEKLRILSERAERHESLWHPLDAH